MLSDFYRELTNAIYLVPQQVQQLKVKEPNTLILAAGATKGQKRDSDADVRYEAQWITARRAALILTNEKLVCGTWQIPLASVTNATLLRVKTFLAKAYVLKVSVNDGSHYQFGLQYDSAWEKQTALKCSVEDGKITYSKFSIIHRLLSLIIVFTLCGCSSWIIFSMLVSVFINNR